MHRNTAYSMPYLRPYFKINPFFPRFFTTSHVNQELVNFGQMDDVNQISNINQIYTLDKNRIGEIEDV